MRHAPSVLAFPFEEMEQELIQFELSKQKENRVNAKTFQMPEMTDRMSHLSLSVYTVLLLNMYSACHILYFCM